MSIKPSKVLVADDDNHIRFPLCCALEREGLNPIIATNESELVQLAPGCDAWIIDVRLPTKNCEGLLGVLALTKEGFHFNRPIVFISVDTEDDAADLVCRLKTARITYYWS